MWRIGSSVAANGDLGHLVIAGVAEHGSAFEGAVKSRLRMFWATLQSQVTPVLAPSTNVHTAARICWRVDVSSSRHWNDPGLAASNSDQLGEGDTAWPCVALLKDAVLLGRDPDEVRRDVHEAGVAERHRCQPHVAVRSDCHRPDGTSVAKADRLE